MENRLSEKLATFIRRPSPAYRSFLYGIADSRPVKNHILKIPASKRAIKTISKENALVLLEACHNLRDYFLLTLLFETGMRIGGAVRPALLSGVRAISPIPAAERGKSL